MGWRDRAKPVGEWRARARAVSDAEATQNAEASALPSELGGVASDYAQPADPEAASRLDTAALRGAAQGATLGWGDELAAAAGAALGNSDKPTIGDRYRDLRDSFRRDNEAARAEHPSAFRAFEIAGGLPLAIATANKGGTGSKLARTMRAMGVSGALAGTTAAGESDADTAGGVLSDSVLPAAIGAAIPGVVAGLGELAPLGRKLLDKIAIKQGRKVLQGGANLLNNTARPVSEEAVREVEGAIKPFGTTTGTAERVGAMRDAAGEQYGAILRSLEERGIRGPEAETLAQKLAAEGRSAASTNTNPGVRSVYDSEAAALRAQEPNGEFTVSRDPEGRLGLTQAEGLKRALQARAKYNRINIAETPQNEARKDVARLYRGAVENEIGSQTAGADPATREIADAFVPVKQRLGRLIEADDALDKAVAQQAKRSGSLHATIAAAPDLATGNLPGAARSILLDSLWRSRGPSTLAYGARQGANALDWLLTPGTTQQAIAAALRRGAIPAASEEAGFSAR